MNGNEGSAILGGLNKILEDAMKADSEFAAGNKSAGKRLRKFMQDLKRGAQAVRKEVLTRRKAAKKSEAAAKKQASKDAKAAKKQAAKDAKSGKTSGGAKVRKRVKVATKKS